MEYKSLEPNLLSSIGGTVPSFTGATPSLFTSTSFLYTLFFVVIVVVASTKYAQAGLFRMEASQHGITKSNEIFKKTTLGLVGVFSLWLILATVNKDLLSGDVGLDALRSVAGVSSNANNGSQSTSTINRPASGESRACDPVDVVKASIASAGGICGNTSCGILSGCKYEQYLPIIKSESERLGVDYKMIVVTMCKESSANPEANNQNPNGTYDCGLMQINQPGPCDVASLRANTTSNIIKGIETMKDKMRYTNQVYPGFPNVNGIPVAGVFASYNCCSNGTIPNSQSESCKTSDGWPAIPKWACPIDPGTGKFNMCGVKSYACELTACLKNVP